MVEDRQKVYKSDFTQETLKTVETSNNYQL